MCVLKLRVLIENSEATSRLGEHKYLSVFEVVSDTSNVCKRAKLLKTGTKDVLQMRQAEEFFEIFSTLCRANVYLTCIVLILEEDGRHLINTRTMNYQ